MEREYALKEIKQNADFTYLCFFCSVPQYSGSEMSAPFVKYILISSTEHVSFLKQIFRFWRSPNLVLCIERPWILLLQTAWERTQ